MRTMPSRTRYLGRDLHVYCLDATRWFATVDESHMLFGDSDGKQQWEEQGEAWSGVFTFVRRLAEDEGIL